MSLLQRLYRLNEALGSTPIGSNVGSDVIGVKLRVWTDNELQARLEQEEVRAQTIWPPHEPVLTDRINAEITRRGIGG